MKLLVVRLNHFRPCRPKERSLDNLCVSFMQDVEDAEKRLEVGVIFADAPSTTAYIFGDCPWILLGD